MPPVAPRESARRLTHASVGLLALLLRYLPWDLAVICCIGGIVLNMFLMPQLARNIFRPEEGRFTGIRAYPMAVLLIVLLFPLRIAAAAWAILALGDSMAALVGRATGTIKLPWNRDKSLQGLVAFIGFGTCAGAIAYTFVEPRTPRTFGLLGEIYQYFGQQPWLSTLNSHYYFWGGALDYTKDATSGGIASPQVWMVALCASVAAGVAESIRVRIDDNFRTAIVGGGVFLYCDPLVRVLSSAH